MIGKTFLSLKGSDGGAITVETAIVAPVLVLMALGGFDASQAVARQTELDSAAAEAAAIVRAKAPAATADLNTIRNIIQTSIDPNNTDPHDTATVTQIYRCGTSTSYSSTSNCGSGVKAWTFIRIVITDQYAPAWTRFGVGRNVNYSVTRVVQVS